MRDTTNQERAARRSLGLRATSAALAGAGIIIGGLTIAVPADAAPSGVAAQSFADVPPTVDSGTAVLTAPGETAWVTGHAKPGSQLNIVREYGSIFIYNVPVDGNGVWGFPLALHGAQYDEDRQLFVQYADHYSELRGTIDISHGEGSAITVDSGPVVLTAPAEPTLVSGHARPNSFLHLYRENGSVYSWWIPVDSSGAWSAVVALDGADFGLDHLNARYADGAPESASTVIDVWYR